MHDSNKITVSRVIMINFKTSSANGELIKAPSSSSDYLMDYD